TSHWSRPAESGVWNLRSTRPRRLGNISATCIPSSLREVMARNSTLGCWDNRRSNSTPVYPVPPTIPTLMRVSAADAMMNPEKLDMNKRSNVVFNYARARFYLHVSLLCNKEAVFVSDLNKAMQRFSSQEDSPLGIPIKSTPLT